MRAQPTTVPKWSPSGLYTWTTKQLKAWYQEYGSFCYWNGDPWEPVVRRLGAGMHEVRFKRRNP